MYSNVFCRCIVVAHSSNIKPSNLIYKSITIAAVGFVSNDIECIMVETEKDITLQEIVRLTREGWPENPKNINPNVKPYFTYRHDITIENRLLLKDHQIIIPKHMQRDILERIHESHLGVVKCKQIARDYVYWPGLAKQIEDRVSRCQTCQSQRHIFHTEPMINHLIPDAPYVKISVDLMHCNHQDYLIIIDYFSKFPEVAHLRSTSSQATINVMKEMFGRYGIPLEVVSDNGPQFSSEEYKIFSREYGFKCIKSSPHYPRSNGQAERYVQTVKTMLKKSILEKSDVNLALLAYRNTTITGLEASPAQLLMSRKLRSRIPVTLRQLKPVIVPSRKNQIARVQAKQKHYHDTHAKKAHKAFEIGNRIKYRTHERTWEHGAVHKKDNTSTRKYQIINKQGNILTWNRRYMFADPTEHDTTRAKQSEPRPEHNDNNKARADGATTPTNYVTQYGRVTQPVIRLGINDTVERNDNSNETPK